MSMTGSAAAGARYLLYLPRALVTWDITSSRHRVIDATVVFADVSGFTALSERLAAAGKVGAEQVTDIINGAFTELLTVARLEGGDLVSFGGDALLLLFDGPDHERRALTAADEMLAALDQHQRAHSPVPLSMSIGVASGPVTMVVAGEVQRELLLIGPTVDEMAALEAEADAGEVLASAATMDAVEPACRGEAKGTGFLLAEPPEPSDAEFDDDLDVDFDVGDHGMDDGDRGMDDEDRGLPVAAPSLDPALSIPPLLRDELQLAGAEGEHRRAVIGFVRVQGVSELLATGGPDGVATALGELIDLTAQVAGEYGITLLSTDVDKGGAKLLLTAGVPAAVPDAEERMLRTMRRVVEGFEALRLHAGVAAGDVFAGDLGASFRRSYNVMGDMVNMAARLAGKAEVARILTLDDVVDVSRTRFETTRLPPVSMKGKSLPVEPIDVGPITGASGSAGGADVDLVGRDAELAVLRSALSDARTGRTSVVALAGPAGMGKSRLIAELRREDDVDVMVGECEEYEQGTAYHAMRVVLRHRIGAAGIRSATEVGELLTRIVEQTAPELRPWLPLLAIPVDAIVPSTAEVDALDPEFRPARLAEATAELLERLVPGPAVIGFDNAQWLDGASRDLLRAIMLRRSDRPWLWLPSQRGGEPAAADRSDVHRVDLGPLTDDESRALAKLVSGERRLPPHVLDEIVQRAEGNPLFVIELATAGETDRLPGSLERLLAARIDALGARDRRLLRYASVLGQQFELDLLVETLAPMAAGIDDPEALQRLDEFLEVTQLGRVRFRQPLVRDVAYAGLAFSRRQEIHGLVGETIERRARHRVFRQAAVLSLHFAQAGRFDKAWEYAVVGGERAAKRFAQREAVLLFERALRVAEHLDELDPTEVSRVGELLGDAAVTVGDFTLADESYRRAEEAAPVARRSAISRKLGLVRENEGDYDGAIALLERALDAATAGSPDLLESRVEAMVAIAGVRYRQGRPEEAARWAGDALSTDPDGSEPAAGAHARQLLALVDADESARRSHGLAAAEAFERLGDHAGLARVLNNLGIDAYFAGRWDEAEGLYRRSREESATAGDVITVATLDNNLAEIFSDQGRFDEAQALFSEADATWRAARYRVGIALVTSNLGRLAARRGDLGAGRRLLGDALEQFSDMGAGTLAIETEARLVEVDIADGDGIAAAERIHRLLPLAEVSADRIVQQSMLHRLLGHALAVEGDREGALAALHRAIAVATGAAATYESALAAVALGELGDGEAAARGSRELRELGAADAARLPLG